MLELDIESIYKGISLLNESEKILLLSKLTSEIKLKREKENELNIYDIRGVGKDVWEGIDAQSYVDQERESWV